MAIIIHELQQPKLGS